jgi:hypothetical protein
VILAALCIASFLLMWVQDGVGASLTIATSRALRRWPGLFDALGTPLQRYGSAISAVVAVRYGLGSWQLVIVVLATMSADFSATNTITPLAARELPTENEPWPIKAWIRRLA